MKIFNVLLASNAHGFALVEALIALLIIGIAVVGFVAQALQTSQRVYEAGHRVQAQVLAEDIIERIKTNPLAWPGPFINTNSPSAPSSCSVASPCTTPIAMALQDISDVKALASQQLPSGQLQVREQCTADAPLPCVIVAWQSTEPTPQACKSKKLDTSSILPQCVLMHFVPGI